MFKNGVFDEEQSMKLTPNESSNLFSLFFGLYVSFVQVYQNILEHSLIKRLERQYCKNLYKIK